MQYVHIVISSTESSGQLFFLSGVLTLKVRGLFFEVFSLAFFSFPPPPQFIFQGSYFINSNRAGRPSSHREAGPV